MKTLILILFASLCFLREIDALDTTNQATYDAAVAAWELAAYGNQNSKLVSKHFEALSSAWDKNSDQIQGHTAYYFGRAAIVTAKKLAVDTKVKEAALILQKAGYVIKKHGVDVTSGRTQSHFEEVAGLHVKVLTYLGTDPLADVAIAYELVRDGDNYVAIREGKDTDQSALATFDDGSLLLPGEKEGTILRIDSKGTVLQALPVAITDGSGPLRSRLTSIFEHQPAGPSGPSRYVKHGAETFFAAQTDNPPTTKSTSLVSSPSPKNGTKEPPAKPMPTTTSGEPTSSTPWRIIVVLIVAAIGLLWLVLKNRK